jgi:methylthioribulose-1-phosphate dehydratase
MAIKHGNRYFMAPSGVQKERLTAEMIFVLDQKGTILEQPSACPAQQPMKLSECAPLFMHAFNIRGAGACIHSHSMHVVMATLLDEAQDEFVVTHQEMIKGISGHCYHEPLVVPIIENTPRECNLAFSLAGAIRAYPKSPAVLVRRHGVYVWGRDWSHAKTQAECLDYLCEWAVKMRSTGLDASAHPFTSPLSRCNLQVWYLNRVPGERGAPSDREEFVPKERLQELGVLHWKLDADAFETDTTLTGIREDRGYSQMEIFTFFMGQGLDSHQEGHVKLNTPNEDQDTRMSEEAQYLLDGSAFVDIHDASDTWIRIHAKKGDMLSLPSGVAHRFSLDRRNYAKVMQLRVAQAQKKIRRSDGGD